MKRIFALFQLVSWLFVVPATVSAAQLYSIQDIGTLGGTLTAGIGLNNKGQVTGYSYLHGNTGVRHAFLYDGSMHDLGVLSGDSFSEGHSINDSGLIT